MVSGFFSILNIFKESRTCHYHGPDQRELWKRLVKCKHIFFTSVGLKFPLWWVTLNSKPDPRVGTFELKSYPKGWEVLPQIFDFDQSPHPIPWSPPLGYNIDCCIRHDTTLQHLLPFKGLKVTNAGKEIKPSSDLLLKAKKASQDQNSLLRKLKAQLWDDH